MPEQDPEAIIQMIADAVYRGTSLIRNIPPP
jgi:hypothetical protein